VTRLGEFSPYGRLFSSGIFLKNTTNNTQIGATFPQSIDNELNLTKNGLGNILGVFLTNSSGQLNLALGQPAMLSPRRGIRVRRCRSSFMSRNVIVLKYPLFLSSGFCYKSALYVD
jgi:hypothetical protein